MRTFPTCINELEATLADVVKSTRTAMERLEHELARATAENRKLKLKLTQVEVALGERRLAESTGKVIDLPNPLRNVN